MHDKFFDVGSLDFLPSSQAMDATGEVERPQKRVKVSYNNTIETFSIAQHVSDQDNRSSIASSFNLSPAGLKVVDSQACTVALTYDGLHANAE